MGGGGDITSFCLIHLSLCNGSIIIQLKFVKEIASVLTIVVLKIVWNTADIYTSINIQELFKV